MKSQIFSDIAFRNSLQASMALHNTLNMDAFQEVNLGLHLGLHMRVHVCIFLLKYQAEYK